MFTGIIEQLGEVLINKISSKAGRLVIKAHFSDAIVGESIAVNGVCLTLLPSNADELTFDVSPETMALTTLGSLRPGDLVNLERAMLATTRFGGHYVSGHVDTTAQLEELRWVESYLELSVTNFGLPAAAYLLTKGSICLEGVSLTINAVSNGKITLMLVPHTLQNTTLSNLTVGQYLNVEFDYFTRIVVHQLKVAGQLKNEVEL